MNTDIRIVKRRNSKQRQVILDVLRSSKSHPTADEIYLLVKDKIPKVSLGTVYRNLEFLVSEQAIKVLAGKTGPRRYDGDLSQHSHLYCEKCGKVIDVTLKKRIKPGDLVKLDGMNVTEVALDFTGLCRECVEAEGRI